MYRYKHLVTFKEDIRCKDCLPTAVHPQDLAGIYLQRECCRKCNQEKRGLPRLNIINDDMIRECLNPKPLTTFEEFRNDFYKATYSKDPILGQPRNCKSKPEHINNISRTFGDPSTRCEPLYELILPNKKPSEVIRDHYYKHDQYIRSHNSYFVGEQVRRHYKPPYDPDKRFGMIRAVPKNGERVQRTMVDCADRFFIATKLMKFLRSHSAFLGTKFDRGEPKYPPGHSYGINTTDQDFCNMKCILEDQDPSQKTDNSETLLLHNAIIYLHKLRQSLINSPFRRIYDLLQMFKRRDIEDNGFLTLREFFEVFNKEFKMRIDEAKIKTALKYYNIIEGEVTDDSTCSIETFWKVFHFNFTLPEGKSLSTLPDNLLNKTTSYRSDFGNVAPDRYITPIRPQPNPKALTVGQILQPDIPSQFGLKHKYFTDLRPKDQLRRIFQTTVEDDAVFEKVWEAAKTKYERNEDLVSIEDMRSLLNMFVLPHDKLKTVQKT